MDRHAWDWHIGRNRFGFSPDNSRQQWKKLHLGATSGAQRGICFKCGICVFVCRRFFRNVRRWRKVDFDLRRMRVGGTAHSRCATNLPPEINHF